MTSIVFFSSLIPFLDLPLMMFKMVASERSCNCCKQSCFNSPLLISCLDRRKEWEEEEKEKSRRNVVGFNIEPLDGRERKVARTLLLSSVATDIYVGSFFIYIQWEERRWTDEGIEKWAGWANRSKVVGCISIIITNVRLPVETRSRPRFSFLSPPPLPFTYSFQMANFYYIRPNRKKEKRETRRDIADDETFRSYEKGRARKL